MLNFDPGEYSVVTRAKIFPGENYGEHGCRALDMKSQINVILQSLKSHHAQMKLILMRPYSLHWRFLYGEKKYSMVTTLQGRFIALVIRYGTIWEMGGRKCGSQSKNLPW